MGLWGGSFLHKTNGAQSQLKWKAPWPRRQDTGVNPREATRRQQGLSGGAAGMVLEAPVSCVTVRPWACHLIPLGLSSFVI